MPKRKFHLYSLPVKKVEPAMPADIRLPGDAEYITGLFFNIPQKYTGYSDIRNAGEISISLDNGISFVISSVEVKTNGHLYNNLIAVNEPVVKNSFARILYKDLNNSDVESCYEVKIYFLCEKKQKPCTPTC